MAPNPEEQEGTPLLSGQSDTELVQRATAGDDAAFAEIVRRHLPALYTFLARYLGDTAVAEDVVQETFVKAWRNMKRFDSERPFKPWLLQIGRNAANDHFRKSRATPFSQLSFRRSPTDDDEVSFETTLADDAPLPPELFEQKELGEKVAAALATLPERDRLVLLLRYEEQLSFEEIAASMNAPMNTVKSWHRRALSRLRTQLADDAPKPHNDA